MASAKVSETDQKPHREGPKIWADVLGRGELHAKAISSSVCLHLWPVRRSSRRRIGRGPREWNLKRDRPQASGSDMPVLRPSSKRAHRAGARSTFFSHRMGASPRQARRPC